MPSKLFSFLFGKRSGKDKTDQPPAETPKAEEVRSAPVEPAAPAAPAAPSAEYDEAISRAAAVAAEAAQSPAQEPEQEPAAEREEPRFAAPIEEAPVEEAPVEEAPAEEASAVDAPSTAEPDPVSAAPVEAAPPAAETAPDEPESPAAASSPAADRPRLQPKPLPQGHAAVAAGAFPKAQSGESDSGADDAAASQEDAPDDDATVKKAGGLPKPQPLLPPRPLATNGVPRAAKSTAQRGPVPNRDAEAEKRRRVAQALADARASSAERIRSTLEARRAEGSPAEETPAEEPLGLEETPVDASAPADQSPVEAQAVAPVETEEEAQPARSSEERARDAERIRAMLEARRAESGDPRDEKPVLASPAPADKTVPNLVSSPQAAAPSIRSEKYPQERTNRMSDAKSVLEMIKEKEVEYVDLRFTDPRGKMQHVTMDADCVDEDMFADGVMFDGSSIAGWKAINESDMTLMPDTATAVMDPFYAQNTLAIICDILEPLTGEPYGRDPRGTAKMALAHLASTGVGDSFSVGPEAEFFVFDDVRFEVSPHRVAAQVDSSDMMNNSWTEYEMGNMGHRPRVKGGYFPVNPVDSGQDMRSEMLSTMKKMGVPVEKHHHEVASAQHELGFKFGPMVETADRLQLYKYCIHNVAAAYGKTATFMPKPVKDDNGTGMHVHQSIWKDGQPLFAGNQYADLSETCLYYIGGILKHAKALNAFTNPSTNSYKRLIPGFEAPVLLAYSARNRSASCRIPFGSSPKAKRVEVRFPDPTANPYLAFSAMMMAGLDGIENKIHPGEPMDKDLYALPPEELKDIPTVCGSLREALQSLEADNAFLTKGGVFTQDQIEAYAELKWEEVYTYEHTPHPVEFDLYYSC